eukprot:403372035
MLFSNPLNESKPDQFIEEPIKGLSTIWQYFQRTVGQTPNNNFLGKLKPNEHTISLKFGWQSYQETFVECESLIKSFNKNNFCQFDQSSNNMRFMAIFSENRPKFVKTQLSCFGNGVVVIPIYKHAPAQQLQAILSLSLIDTIAVSKGTIKQILSLVQIQKSAQLKNIICFDKPTSQQIELAAQNGIKTSLYCDLVQQGTTLGRKYENRLVPLGEDTCLIMFTGGTAGQQKGAMISNRNLISNNSQPQYFGYEFNENDKYLSQVHLSNIQEQSMFACCIINGFSVGGSQVSQIKEKAENLGGNIRYLLSGGSPLTQEVFDFLKQVFECPIMEAYGTTETSGAICTTNGLETEAGLIGGPVPSLKIKLVDLPDQGYKSSNLEPSGEIYVKGSSVFKGYFKNLELTKTVCTSDGWYKTGDIGQLVGNGGLKLIDRVINLKQTRCGKYIAPTQLEKIFSQCSCVRQIFITTNPNTQMTSAILFPEVDFIYEIGFKHGLTSEFDLQSLDKLLENALIKSVVQEQLDAKAQEFNLKECEKIQSRFLLIPSSFQELGLLTPSMKMMREAAELRFKLLIEEIDNPTLAKQMSNLSIGSSLNLDGLSSIKSRLTSSTYQKI